jgi:cyclopropane-fatty-acyl-phospholipid synthase
MISSSVAPPRTPPVPAVVPGLGRHQKHGAPNLSQRLARDGVLAKLQSVRGGRILLSEGGREHVLGAETGLEARLTVHDPRFWIDVATGGALGAAESYARGEWDTDALTTLVRILARDRDTLSGLERGLARLRTPALRALHALQGNTRSGSRRNIAAHYDLGNDFFALFLDRTRMYSCALWPHRDATLDKAAAHKLDVVCEKLGIRAGHEVLEIGTGWGGFALHAARRGAHVTTTTISREQAAFAREAFAAEGLADRITLLETDYRDLPALGRRFDRVVSIEMIEAVGYDHLDEYFSVISRTLAPDGLALVQAITIPDRDEAAYRANVDFIQKHIFPGSALPSLRAITAAVAATTLRIDHAEDLAPHYARTLREWHARFEAQEPRIAALGFDETFRRLWRWYFCYCEAGFLERTVGLRQLLLAGPRAGTGIEHPVRGIR